MQIELISALFSPNCPPSTASIILISCTSHTCGIDQSNGSISSGSELVNQDELKASENALALKIKSPYSLFQLINFTWSIVHLDRRKLLCTICLQEVW